MKRLFNLALLLTFVAALATHVAAVTTVLWKDDTRSNFEKGTLDQLAVTAKGHLRLSNAITSMGKLSEEFVWCLARDPKGNLIAGTGDQGTLYKIAPDGKTRVLYKSPELHVHCLAIDKQGNIYAGTSPHGIILKIKPDGTAKTFYDAGDEYIWCLALSKDGQQLYAGTGPNGRLLKIGMDGKAVVLFDARQSHILCMLMDGKGNLYTGAEPDGVIYRTSPEGHTTVVYDAEENEIHALAIDHKGNIYAGTADAGGPSFPSLRSRMTTLRRSSSDKSGKKVLDTEMKEAPDTKAEEEAIVVTGGTRPPLPRSPISAPARPARIGPNTVYRISPDGRVTDFVDFQKSMVTCLAADERFLYVGTGDKGRLYKVALESDRSVEIIASDEHKYVLSILGLKEGLAFSTGAPGSVRRFSGNYAKKGTFESRVCKAKGLAKWGRLSAQVAVPNWTSISIATRTGNSEKPDETWSPWSKEHGSLKAPGFVIHSPPGRYIQYRATFKTNKPHATPELSSVSLAYLPMNNAPQISGLVVDGTSKSKTSTSKSSSKSSGSSGTSSKGSSAGVPTHKSKRTISWKATDKDGDKIVCDLFYKATDETTWKPLKKKLTKSPFKHEWDTLTVPDGKYRVKVVASDAPSNPPEKAMSDEEVCEPFAIDNTRPLVQGTQAKLQKDGRCIVRGKAVDGFSNILTMSYSINADDWILAYPSDDIFDMRTEPFAFTTSPLPKGENTIVIKAIDAVGNVGCGKVVVKVK